MHTFWPTCSRAVALGNKTAAEAPAVPERESESGGGSPWPDDSRDDDGELIRGIAALEASCGIAGDCSLCESSKA